MVDFMDDWNMFVTACFRSVPSMKMNSFNGRYVGY